ncbi:MAG: hypothetical protein ING69_10605 [Rhodocyclaceae bacterium]|nr:hypothetical protein [Rhodocyclaceae bacterium]
MPHLISQPAFAAAGAEAVAAIRKAKPVFFEKPFFGHFLPRGWGQADNANERLVMFRGAVDTLQEGPILFEFPPVLDITRAVLARLVDEEIVFDLFFDDGWRARAKFSAKSDLFVECGEGWDNYFQPAIVALDALRGDGVYRIDPDLRQLQLRSEFSGFDGVRFAFDDAAQDREDTVRIFADVLIAEIGLTKRLLRSGFVSDKANADRLSRAVDADELIGRLVAATKYVCDDHILDRAEGLVDRPELREKTELWARVPGNHTWIEIPHPHFEEGVLGFLIDCENPKADAPDISVTVFEKLSDLHGFDARRGSFHMRIGKPDAEVHEGHPALLIAILSLICAPKFTRVQGYKRQGPLMTRRRKKAGLPALQEFSEVTVDKKLDVDEVFMPTNALPATSSGVRRRHRVRGFWRYKRQKLEFVREHFRGREELGTTEHRYRVTAGGGLR